jgi:hypothetical protein
MPYHDGAFGRRRFASMPWCPLLLSCFVLLGGCQSDPTKVDVKFEPLDKITLSTPLGGLVFSFSKEKEKATPSPAELARQAKASKGALLFSAFDFSTGPLPEGCKDFQAGRYGNLELPKDGAVVADIEHSVEALKKGPGAPDEAVIALAVYKSRAFRSVCGPTIKAKLKPGSRINGWVLNDKAFQSFAKISAEEIDVTPRIIIIVLEKSVFDRRLSPTAANLLLSRYRYDVPPNTDSLAFDPKTGSTVLTYSQDLGDVQIDGATRDALTGGVVRIFVGARYMYVVEFSTNTAGISDSKWAAFQTYIDSFRYVAPAGVN